MDDDRLRRLRALQQQNNPLNILRTQQNINVGQGSVRTVRRDAPLAPPKQAPSYSSPWAKFKDTFDANTAQDRYKRQVAGSPLNYQDEQKALGARNVYTNPVGSFLMKAGGEDIARSINTAGGAIKKAGSDAYDVADLIRISALGSDNAYKSKLKNIRARQTSTVDRNGGFLGVGSNIDNFEDLKDGKKFAAATFKTGSDLAQVVPIAAASAAGIKGARLGFKVGAEAVIGGTANVASDAGRQYQETGKIDPKSLAMSFAAGTAFPVVGFGAGKLGRKVSNFFDNQAGAKLVRNIVQETDETVIANAVRKAAPELDEVAVSTLSKDLAKATSTSEVKKLLQNPTVPKSTPSVNKDVITSLRSNKNPQETNVAVKALFPELDEPTTTNISTRLAQATNDTEIEKVIQEAQARQAEVKASIEQATPSGEKVAPNSQQQAQADAYQQAVAEQPIATQAPEQPVTGSVDSPTPQAVAGATDATQVPQARQADQLTKDLAEIEKARKELVKKPNLFRRIEDKLNPTALATRIDRARGTQGDSLTRAADSVEGALEASRNTQTIARQKLDDAGISNIMGKYVGEEEGAFSDYLNARFAKEVFDKKKQNIMPEVNPNEFDVIVRNFEATHPEAAADAQLVKKWGDGFLDQAVDSGLIDADTAKFVKSSYDNFAPLERLFPDNVENMTSIQAGVGTVGRQRVLQSLEGSDVPLSRDFSRFVNRANLVENQLSNNKIAQLLQDSINDKAVGGRSIITSEQSKALAEQKDILKALREEKVKTQKSATKARLGASKANRELKQVETEAARRARQLLQKTVADPDAQAAISDLSRKELVEVFTDFASDGTPTPNTVRTMKKLADRSDKHAKMVTELTLARNNRQMLEGKIAEVSVNISDLRPDKTTGSMTLSGFENGFPFKIQIDDPQVISMLKNVRPAELSGIAKTFATIWKPFRTAFTGFLNPNFVVRASIGYDMPMTGIISPVKVKNRFHAEAVADTFTSLSRRSGFMQDLQRVGASSFTASKTPFDPQLATQRIAAQNNMWLKTKNIVNPKKLAENFEALDQTLGKTEGMHRARHAKNAYLEAIDAGADEANALARARYVYNNVGPNYQNSSRFLRELDAIMPYTNAAVAGTRSFLKAARARPGSTAAKSAVIFGAPAMAAVAVSYSNNPDKTAEFYEDMQASGKEYILDNNFIVVTDGAERSETGEWTGVYKIPVPPEMRGANKSIWRTAKSLIEGQGLESPQVYATALFDSMTGQLSPVDPVMLAEGQSLGDAARPNLNPAINLGLTMATGKNINTGNEVIPEDMKGREAKDQSYPWTGGVATSVGEALNMSPLKVQAFIDSFGAPAKAAQTAVEQQMFRMGKIDKEQVSENSYWDQAVRSYHGAWGKTPGAVRKEHLAEVRKGLSQRQKTDFESYLRGTEFDDKGEPIYDPFRKYVKSSLLFDDGVFSAAKQDAYFKNKQSGQPVDPLFDLSKAQRLKILHSRGMVPGAKDPELNFSMKDQDWYVDFKAAETDYYTKQAVWAKKQGYESRDDPNPYPTPSARLQTVFDEYNALPKNDGPRGGSKTRRDWIVNNPDKWESMQQQYALVDKWTNFKRQEVGLEPLPEDQYLAMKDKDSFSSGSGGGKFGYGSGKGSSEKNQRQYLSQLLSGVTAGGKAPTIDTKPSRAKIKVKTPSGKGRRFKRIKLT